MQDADLKALNIRLIRRAQRLGLPFVDAEDLAQDTLLRLLQKLATTPLSDPDRYALVTLHNLARNRWRQQRPTEELEENTAQVPPAAPPRLALAAIQSALPQLPNEQTRILSLILAGEHSPTDIAHALRLPAGTVMSRLARARKHLRHTLDLAPDASIEDLF